MSRPAIMMLFIVILALIVSAPVRTTTSVARGFQEPPTVAARAEATPGTLDQIAPYPDGFVLTALALAPLDAVPANPATIRLERYTLNPGDRLAGATHGPRLIVVESGELLVESADIDGGALGATQSLLIPPDAAVTLAPLTGTAAFLQLRVESDAPDAVQLDSTTEPRILLTGSPRLPRGEATISIVRLSADSGADAGQRVFSGPVGLAVESGSLTVVDLDGQPTQLDAGGSLFAPAYTAHHLRNDGPEPVSGLAVGVLPTSPALAGAPVASPTPAVDVAATATFAALLQSESDLQATIAAGETFEANRQANLATSEAVATVAITNAQATTAAIALNAVALSSELATANARAATAEDTIAGQQPTISAQAAGLSTATAREASLVATSQAHEIALANHQAEVGSLSTRVSTAEEAALAAGDSVDQAEATNSAQALALQTVVATATAQALQAQAAQGTIAAQLAGAQGNMTSLSAAEGTRTAELAAAQQTVTAQGAALATFAAATAPAINPTFREVMIEDNVSGVVGGNEAARATVLAEVRQELQSELSQGCEAGLVLTFGYATDVNPGVTLAGAVNELLAQEIPEMFAGADLEDFASVEEPAGRVQIRVYLTTACDWELAPGPSTPASTSPPIVPAP